MAGGSGYNQVLQRMTPEERAALEALAKKRGDAFKAGFVDSGGIGADLAEVLGFHDAATKIRSAQADPETGGAAAIGSFMNPLAFPGSIAKAGKETIAGLWDAATSEDVKPPQLMDKEVFFSERRTKRGSLKDAQDAAESKVRESKAYLDTLKEGRRRTAQGLVDAARKNAESGWKSDQDTIANEDARLEQDYAKHASDYDRQMEAFYGRDFADRNPGLAKAFSYGGPLLAGALMRTDVKHINKGLEAAIKAAQRPGMTVAQEAKALARLKQREGSALNDKLWAGAAASVVPLELQALGDVVDRKSQSPDYQNSKGEWVRNRSQERAEKKLSDPIGYIADNAFSLASGAVGAVTGAKIAGKTPYGDARGQLVQPDAKALQAVADRRVAEATIQRQMDDALNLLRSRPGAPGNPHPSHPSGGQPPGGGPAQQPGPTGRGRQSTGSPAQNGGTAPANNQPRYAPYKNDAREDAQRAFYSTLDNVPTQARASYSPDFDELMAAIKAGSSTQPNPAVVGPRLKASIKKFNDLRASGKDPYSLSGGISLTGGKEKLAILAALESMRQASAPAEAAQPDDALMRAIQMYQQTQRGF